MFEISKFNLVSLFVNNKGKKGGGGAAGVLATQKSKISRGLSILTLHMVLLAQYVAQVMPQIGTKTVPFQWGWICPYNSTILDSRIVTPFLA